MHSDLDIYAKIIHDVIDGEVNLPTLPDVALRIRRTMQEPNCDLNRIEGIIQTDAGLSAHLIQMANSPLYRGWRQTKDLKRAVSLFGLDMTRNLCLSYSLRAMFRFKNPYLKKFMQAAWKDSARRAALSALLAQHAPRISADRALLAGLLQEIGLPLLYSRLEQYPEALEDSEILRQLVDSFCAKISVTLLDSWGFDEELQTVSRSRRDWFRDENKKTDLADVVLLANLHTLILSGGDNDELPPIDILPAYIKLDPGPLTPRGTLQVLEDATDSEDLEAAIAG